MGLMDALKKILAEEDVAATLANQIRDQAESLRMRTELLDHVSQILADPPLDQADPPLVGNVGQYPPPERRPNDGVWQIQIDEFTFSHIGSQIRVFLPCTVCETVHWSVSRDLRSLMQLLREVRVCRNVKHGNRP